MSDTPRSINHCDCGADKSHCFDCLFEVSCQLERENAELKKQLSDIEEREAACCPEDVSFDALIAALRKQVLRLERKNAELRNRLRIADDLIDEYAEVVEHCDNVDEIREQIKAALEAAERGEG